MAAACCTICSLLSQHFGETYLQAVGLIEATVNIQRHSCTKKQNKYFDAPICLYLAPALLLELGLCKEANLRSAEFTNFSLPHVHVRSHRHIGTTHTGIMMLCMFPRPCYSGSTTLLTFSELERQKEPVSGIRSPSMLSPPQVNRKESFKSGKSPQRILFVEELTKILTDNLPDIWRLGQAYFSGKLLKEVGNNRSGLQC